MIVWNVSVELLKKNIVLHLFFLFYLCIFRIEGVILLLLVNSGTYISFSFMVTLRRSWYYKISFHEVSAHKAHINQIFINYLLFLFLINFLCFKILVVPFWKSLIKDLKERSSKYPMPFMNPRRVLARITYLIIFLNLCPIWPTTVIIADFSCWNGKCGPQHYICSDWNVVEHLVPLILYI